MKRKTILLLIGFIVLIIAIAALVYRYQNKAAIIYWRTSQVEKGNVNVMVTATGTMAADTSVDVGVQVSGIIAKIKADFNNSVKKGQVIAILDTTLYYAAKIDASASLQRAEAASEQAKKELDRTSFLFKNGAVAQADYDLALTAYKNASGNLLSAQAQLNRANINLRYCTVTAPIRGMVIARNVQVGNMVIASFNSPVLFTIVNNLTKMQVQANVDEADIGQVKIGQRADFTVDAYPNDVFKGVITQVRHQPVVVQNVVNYVVLIEVENPQLKLMPGLTANANIYIDERNDVLKVASGAFNFSPPLDYIQSSKHLPDSTVKFWLQKIQKASQVKKQQIVESSGTTGYLWLLKNKEVFPVQVQKGLNDGSFTEISGNIHENDTIVTGINSAAPVADAKAKSPFMPSFPSRKK